MYSIWSPPKHGEYQVTFVDKKMLKHKGWRATHLDGTESWVNKKDLNIRGSSMWRMYYRRTFGKGPPSERHLNFDAGTFDRWLWRLEPGEPLYVTNWHRRLFESINKTYGYAPGDPRFIVSLRARGERMVFDQKNLDLLRREKRNATAVWDDSWSVDF